MSELHTPRGEGASADVLSPWAATLLIVERNVITYRAAWKLFITGFLEPVLYLLSIGIGVGALVERIDYHGLSLPYAEFVAPAMLATSAFNGALQVLQRFTEPALSPIWLNLAMIAGDALVRGGQLDIGAERRDDHVEIVVRGEGPRIVLDDELRDATQRRLEIETKQRRHRTL